MATTLKVSVPQHLRSKVGATRDGDKFGRTTGLRMVHFVDAMFRQNDKAKLDDDSLFATLESEFNKRRGKGDKGIKGESGRIVKTIQPVSAYRAYHNSGRHGCGDGVHVAYRYRDDGSMVVRSEGKPKAKGKGRAKKGTAAKAIARGKAASNGKPTAKSSKPKAKAARKAKPTSEPQAA